MESKTSSETPFYSPVERKDAVLLTSPFPFRDSGSINTNIPRRNGLMYLKLFQQNKQQRWLNNCARLPLHEVTEKEEDVLAVSRPAAKMGLSVDAMRAMEVLSEAILVIYTTLTFTITKNSTKQVPEKNFCILYTWHYAALLTKWGVGASWRTLATTSSDRVAWMTSEIRRKND